MKSTLLAALLLSACIPIQPAVSDYATVPPDTAQKCQDVCSQMGLTMSAVVVVSNRAGCVCEKPGAPPPHAAAGASAASSGALIAILDEEAKKKSEQEEKDRKSRQDDEQKRIQQQNGVRP
jgi:hypothetical protein